jgi:peptidoglycan/LPS O-acetylase OafA/YrhL
MSELVHDRRFPCLNAIRAIAAIGVVATHTAFDTGEVGRGWHGAVLSRLDFGVTLFFVLSGFLLSRPFFLARVIDEPHPSHRHFYWKRSLRILPLYWATVVIALAALPENQGTRAAEWARHLTLTQIYAPNLLPTGLTQMWSLSTEVAFYVALPMLAWILLRLSPRQSWQPRRLLGYLAVISAAGVAWQVVSASASSATAHYAQMLPGFLPWFCVGMAFGVVSADLAGSEGPGRFAVIERWGADLTGCWVFALSVFAVACTPLCGPRLLATPTGWEAFFKCVLYGVSAAFLVLPLVFGPELGGSIRRGLATRIPVWLGDVSYGIFCLHLIALETVLDVLDVPIFTGRFEEVFALTLGVTVVMAALSYYALERPFLHLKNVGPFARSTAAPMAMDATIKA